MVEERDPELSTVTCTRPEAYRRSDELATFETAVPKEEPHSVTPPRTSNSLARSARQAMELEMAFARAHAPRAEDGAEVYIFDARGFATVDVSRLEPKMQSLLPGGVRRPLVFDDRGKEIVWPWDQHRRGTDIQADELDSAAGDPVARYFASPEAPHASLGSHTADATIMAGLRASTADGNMGENATGVRAWKTFNARNRRAYLRPMDPNAPLSAKLHEERWILRFVAELVDDRSIAPETARGYFSAASGWHRRRTGIAFAGGLDLGRLKDMIKGLRKLKEPGPKKIRRGVSPQMLRTAMDMILPPNTRANVNKRRSSSRSLCGRPRTCAIYEERQCR